jgi:hypothetical protein
METDLASMLVLLMTRLTDSADDDGIVDDFCESFHLSKKAVVAAVSTQARGVDAAIAWASIGVIVRQFTFEIRELI